MSAIASCAVEKTVNAAGTETHCRYEKHSARRFYTCMTSSSLLPSVGSQAVLGFNTCRMRMVNHGIVLENQTDGKIMFWLTLY